jgi:sortase B
LDDSRKTAAELRRIQNREETKSESTDLPALPVPKATATAAAASSVPAAAASPVPAAAASPVPAAAASPVPAAAPVPSPAASDGRLPAVTYPDNPEWKVSERFRKLRKKGSYIIGWLSFDEVDEAVCQKDNTYFLNHDATGKRNGNGAIFLDSGVSLMTRPYTLFLYGHNMKNGNMFGKLKKYKETGYFYKHRIISFDSLYEDGQYAVFAVLEMDTAPGTSRWYNLWSLDTPIVAEREEAIRTLQKRSVIRSVLDVKPDDQLLLLITCVGDDEERLVVAARRLRDGEQADQLQMSPESASP